MNEQFTKLFSLPARQYRVGAPVIIEAGALHKDNESQKIFAQIKLKSISEKTIKAATVFLQLFDTAGNEIGSVSKELLDLRVTRDSVFGQMTPIFIDDERVRSFSPCVVQVVYNDSLIWTDTGIWSPIPQYQTLIEHLNKPELVAQYQLETGSDCKYAALKYEDLWFCSCGAINSKEEKICHSCSRDYSFLRESFDVDSLTFHYEKRINEIAQKEVEKKAKVKRIVKKIIPILTISVFLIISGIIFNSKVIKPKNTYTQAIDLINSNQYSSGIDLLKSLGDYKDSPEQILEAQYAQAKYLREQNIYDNAIRLFSELGQYSDSPEQLLQTYLSKAEYELSFKDPDILSIKNTLSKLADYPQFQEQCNNITYLLAIKKFNNEKFNNAIGLLKENPDYEESKYYLGMCFYKQNDFSSAEAWLSDVPISSEHFSEVQPLLDECYYKIAVDKCDKTLSEETLSEAKEYYVKANSYGNSEEVIELIDSVFDSGYIGKYVCAKDSTELIITCNVDPDNLTSSYNVSFRNDKKPNYYNCYFDEKGNLLYQDTIDHNFNPESHKGSTGFFLTHTIAKGYLTLNNDTITDYYHAIVKDKLGNQALLSDTTTTRTFTRVEK